MEKTQNRSKYTFDYDPHIESLLDESLEQIAREVQQDPCAKHLKYLVLAGGYGRGEGGILNKTERLIFIMIWIFLLFLTPLFHI